MKSNRFFALLLALAMLLSGCVRMWRLCRALWC